ncbi:hypothetical protein ACJVC5_08960 [Peredibacter sp. HCB2-198]|uniref:hypothetical protein n=1 Tax=Peredibacter sp. HCB2-198 TaxID=3383025 RepID=UPI0038B6A552
MMLKLLILIVVSLNFSHAAEIKPMFARKEYKRIVDTYNSPEKWKDLTTKEMVMLSYSLRKLKRYREDSKVIFKILKRDHAKDHADIRKKIRNKETLDSEDYPKSLPIYYWYIYNDFADILLSHNKLSAKLEEDKKIYIIFRQIVSELEFREGKAEKLNDKVMTHLQYLEDKVYYFTFSINLQYVSWQHDATLHRSSSNTNTGLIITNQGYCLGGDVGIENGFYHFLLDGCFLVGSGGVSAYGDSNITYQQNIPATGLKIGPMASMIVSSSKSRIGIGLPIIYTSQKLTQPSDTDYKVEEESPISALATINSRWQFGKWYLRAEFGQYFKKQESFWGMGFGRQF